MSEDLEPRLREALRDQNRAPLGLRDQVIARAVATPQRRRSSWTLRLAPAVAGLVLGVAAVALITPRTTGPEPLRVSPAPPAVLAFGRLPAPDLHPAQGVGAGGGTSQVVPYYGPATMTWNGQLPSVPRSAAVYRLTPAGEAQVQGLQTTVKIPGYTVTATLDNPVAQLPLYYLNATRAIGGPPADANAARAAADAELSRLGMSPPWPFTVSMSPPLYTFHYQRLVDLGGGARAGLVDGGGDPLGIDVTVDSTGVVAIHGLIPETADQPATYPLGAPDPKQATSAPAQVPDSGTPPDVTLTRAHLVYAVTRSGEIAYLEPAYLFTGTFTTANGQFEKRVLVPALASSALAG
ncbi:MAG TPA: hypothetical protein VF134_09140 [Candidatus Dormibacteraeota bacterium]